MDQLKQRMVEVSDDQMADTVREARDEALAEAKAIIKETILQVLLERALGQLSGTRSESLPARRAEEQIRQEIEAIRMKIAENERLLSQTTPDRRVPTNGGRQETEIAGRRMDDHRRDGGEESYGYYVYGIVMDGDSQLAAELPEQGIDTANPVYALQPAASARQPSAIDAIVSRVSLQEFGQEELRANLKDLEWLEAKVRAHQAVLETVLANFTLIPMRFCTICQSESRVQEMLAHHYDEFVEMLTRLEGRREWGVKVYCDSGVLTQRVEEINDRVRDLRAEMEQKSSGAAYFLRKKLEESIAREAEHLSDEVAQHSHDRLSSHSEEAVINPLQNRQLTGRGETMVLNGAYLVAEELLTAFQAELSRLQDEYGNLGFSYEVTGPWPPYNFVALSFEEDIADE
jgi:hypothetical protein